MGQRRAADGKNGGAAYYATASRGSYALRPSIEALDPYEDSLAP
jgi:hypothetical protein